jgi:chemotaxis signal transduction protein
MTQTTSTSPMPGNPRRGEQTIVFSIAGYSFLISAGSVQEIRSTDSLGGVVRELGQSALRKVRHVVERDARSYYVVSGCEHFHLNLTRPTSVLILRNVPVAVLVDGIDEMAEMRVLLALPRSFQGEERAWYRGLTVLDRKVLPVVNPQGFLSAAELQLLEEENPGLLRAGETKRGMRGPV